MKAKFVLIFLFVLLTSSQDRNVTKGSAKWCKKEVGEKSLPRTLNDYSILLDNTDDSLSLTFLFSLEEADITIVDGNGREIVKEYQSSIYEGRTIFILSVKNYPCFVEITSPILRIYGEIVLEK